MTCQPLDDVSRTYKPVDIPHSHLQTRSTKLPGLIHTISMLHIHRWQKSLIPVTCISSRTLNLVPKPWKIGPVKSQSASRISARLLGTSGPTFFWSSCSKWEWPNVACSISRVAQPRAHDLLASEWWSMYKSFHINLHVDISCSHLQTRAVELVLTVPYAAECSSCLQ